MQHKSYNRKTILFGQVQRLGAWGHRGFAHVEPVIIMTHETVNETQVCFYIEMYLIITLNKHKLI